ncbi:Glucitol operon repressor [subsurface metagenome]
MKKDERIDVIYRKLQIEKSLKINDIIKELNISIATLRRDLSAMEKKGLIYKSYGYIRLVEEDMRFEPSYIYRLSINKNLKARIAKKAVELLKNRDSIFLDVGSTALSIVEQLSLNIELNIITNWIPIATKISECKKFHCFLIGGEVRKEELSVGPIDIKRELSLYNINKAFICASGVSLEKGISDYSDIEIKTKQEVIRNAEENILLADSTKFNKTGFLNVCRLEEFNKIIVDDNLDKETISKLEKKGIEVILA